MKCPNCDYVSFDYLVSCRKCGRSLTDVRGSLNLLDFRPEVAFLLGSLIEDFKKVKIDPMIPPLESAELPPSPEEQSVELTTDTGSTVEIGDIAHIEAATVDDTASQPTGAKITFTEDEIDQAFSQEFLQEATEEGESTQPLDLDLSLREISSTELADDALIDLVGEKTEPIVDLGDTTDGLELGGDTEPIDLGETVGAKIGDTDQATVIETDEILMTDSAFDDLDIKEEELDDLAKELEDALITAERDVKKELLTGEDSLVPPEGDKKEKSKSE